MTDQLPAQPGVGAVSAATGDNSGGDNPGTLGHVETWIFDLDNTLYNVSPRLLADTDRRISAYIAEALGIDAAEARRIQKQYFHQYGLTIRGLMLHHGVDPHHYFDYLHPHDLTDVVPNPRLAEAIGRLEGRKVIYTNAWTRHVEVLLDHVGLIGRFDAIYDIIDAEFIAKPAVEGYAALCARHAIDPAAAVMIDDIQRNLEPARAAGSTTVWLKTEADWAKDQHPGEHVDHVTEDLLGWIEAVVSARNGGQG